VELDLFATHSLKGTDTFDLAHIHSLTEKGASLFEGKVQRGQREQACYPTTMIVNEPHDLTGNAGPPFALIPKFRCTGISTVREEAQMPPTRHQHR
jgi:hypothetical protein